MFPANNVWNTPVDQLPVDPNSAAYVNTIGAGKYLHPDFSAVGGGIPYTVVPGTQPKVPIVFGDGAVESDPGPYPIPPNALVEPTGDRHVLVLENTNCILYELFLAYLQPDGSWTASSGAVFDLKSNQLRPAGWTSSDAAGFAVLPGLVRYEEVVSGEIKHAIRFSAPQTRREYIWPARHYASTLTGAQYPPMGQRFRLKASFNISPYPADVQVILRALKKYGMILSDNGSSWFLTGVPDDRWDDATLHTLHQVLGSNLEAVDESSLMVDPNSGAVTGPTASLVQVTLNPATTGERTTTTLNRVTLSLPAPVGGAVVSLSSTDLAVASVPASVLVPGGATSATFSITTSAATNATTVTISAFYLGITKSATLTVSPVAIQSVAFSPSSVTGGVNAQGGITLTAAAPPEGFTIPLSSNLPSAATVPASVTVPAGASSAIFTATTYPQVATRVVQVTASGGATSATLTVQPPQLRSIVFSAAQIPGGLADGVTISLSGKAPAQGIVVTLASSNPAVVPVPTTTTVTGGASTRYFTLTTAPVSVSALVTITASGAGSPVSAVLTVTMPTISMMTLSASSVKGGTAVTATVRLRGVVAASGLALALSSSNPAAATVPASVTVPGGTSSFTFPVTTKPVSISSSTLIRANTATSSGYIKLTVNP